MTIFPALRFRRSAPLPTTGGSVYAPTAAVLYQFREVALGGPATRLAHFDQPAFA